MERKKPIMHQQEVKKVIPKPVPELQRINIEKAKVLAATTVAITGTKKLCAKMEQIFYDYAAKDLYMQLQAIDEIKQLDKMLVETRNINVFDFNDIYKSMPKFNQPTPAKEEEKKVEKPQFVAKEEEKKKSKKKKKSRGK